MNTPQRSFSSDWIHQLESGHHWKLYHHQLHLIMNEAKLTPPASITEVGIGSGLTSSYLSNKGFKVTTIDIDPDKKPEIVGDITQINLPKTDAFMAFEIFEHISFAEARSVWETLSHKGVTWVAFSVPYAYKTYIWAELWIPFLGSKTIHLGRKRSKITQKHHFWELGLNNHSAASVIASFSSLNYYPHIHYRYRNHHFFLMKLKTSSHST